MDTTTERVYRSIVKATVNGAGNCCDGEIAYHLGLHDSDVWRANEILRDLGKIRSFWANGAWFHYAINPEPTN